MKKFEDLTFADHYMFEKVLQNKEICKELLERLLKIKIERLEYPEIEKEISPYYESKGVRLDVYVKDTEKCRKMGSIRVESTRIRVKVLREYDFGVSKCIFR